MSRTAIENREKLNKTPSEFKVIVPNDRIAVYPSEVRDEAKLMVVDKQQSEIVHIGKFRDIKDFISGDLLVLNDTKVIPARVYGTKPSSGNVELLFLAGETEKISGSVIVSALIKPSRRLRKGLQISLPGSSAFTLVQRRVEGGWSGKWTNSDDLEFYDWLAKNGSPPLPPYIKRKADQSDFTRYQTVYAENSGSLAAPTAGLHFTSELLSEMKTAGTETAKLTLNVGLGTFIPIRTGILSEHEMESESYHIPETTAVKINQALESNRNITVVGTTCVRTLEDAALKNLPLRSGTNAANLFIYPSYDFKIVNRLITNFHRPDSTLLQLVAALAGWKLINKSYQAALDEGFRFYSYGDAMFII